MGFKIIDAHMHIGPSPSLPVPDHSLESQLQLMDHLGIERCISANQFSLLGQYEKGLASDFAAHEASGGRVFSFFGFRPNNSQEAMASMRAHKGDPRCVGIKIHPCGTFVDADSESYRPAWEMARELKLPIMSHTWDISTYNPGQKYAVAGKFEKWLAEYPDITFVFGHCGGRYNGIKQAIELGKKYPNAYFDITGDIWANGFLEALVEGVGADHIVYGSDCVMIEQRPMLGVVYGANISNLEREKILYHTAARIYFGEE